MKTQEKECQLTATILNMNVVSNYLRETLHMNAPPLLYTLHGSVVTVFTIQLHQTSI